jgi:hypothetical protein
MNDLFMQLLLAAATAGGAWAAMRAKVSDLDRRHGELAAEARKRFDANGDRISKLEEHARLCDVRDASSTAQGEAIRDLITEVKIELREIRRELSGASMASPGRPRSR